MAGNADLLVDGPVRLGVKKGAATTANETAFFAKGADGLFTNEWDSSALKTFIHDVGYTTAAFTATFGQTTRQRTVQQKSQPVKNRRTGRTATYATTLGELGLDNLDLVMDLVLSKSDPDLTAPDKAEPRDGNDIPDYTLFVDGSGPHDLGRRLLARRVNSTAEVAYVADSENDSGLPVTWTGLEPEATTTGNVTTQAAAWTMVDESLVTAGVRAKLAAKADGDTDEAGESESGTAARRGRKVTAATDPDSSGE